MSSETTAEVVTRAVQDSMAGRNFCIVESVEQLLIIATRFEVFECVFESKDSLRFLLPGESISVRVDRAKVKLRTMCARLAALVNEQGTGEIISPYGGEGRLAFRAKSGESAHFQLRFENTPEKQEFHLTRIST